MRTHRGEYAVPEIFREASHGVKRLLNLDQPTHSCGFILRVPSIKP